MERAGKVSRRGFLRAAFGGAAAAAAALGGRSAAMGAESARPAAENAPAAGGDGAARRPNIVLIVADDLGYGHLGCYGQRKIATPHLDRMAAEGMRFTQFYAGFTVCAPSRSVLMTGLHHGHTPIRSNAGSATLLDDETTLAQVLQRAGYATGGFGKWGLGLEDASGAPVRKGFDEFWGFYHQVHAHFYWPAWVWHNAEKVSLPGNAGGARGTYVDDFLHAKALDFIRRSAAAGKPFFCYVPTIIPHVELSVPEDSEKPYRGKFPKIKINDGRRGYLGSDDAHATYAGMISRMDRNVGQVLALLKELGIDGETLVLFTSDNGPQGGPWQPLCDFFGGAGALRGSKGSLYEGGIRVPLLARWPGKVQAGATSDHAAAFYDFLPTLADLAGAKAPANDGVSFVPTLLAAGGQKPHEYLFWTGAVRMGDWKAVGKRDGGWELYDLRTDLGETRDVAAKHPDVVGRIEAIHAAAYREPRQQVGGRRVDIGDFVEGARVKVQNAR